MSPLADRLRKRYYSHLPHPYQLFEDAAALLLPASGGVLLDAGCGRGVPVLRKYLGRCERLIGVDLVEFTDVPAGIETYRTDLATLPLADASVDLIISRSVFEHLVEPAAVYAEMARVLRPGGRILFLTANMWDYGTLVARMVPNRFHAKVVKAVEGRDEQDTFPTAYRSNTRADVQRLAGGAGLRVQAFEYLSQYPNYLMFSGVAFFLGMCYEKVIARFDALRVLRGWILVTLVKPT
jgi:SAM-dependent methyltransferase